MCFGCTIFIAGGFVSLLVSDGVSLNCSVAPVPGMPRPLDTYTAVFTVKECGGMEQEA